MAMDPTMWGTLPKELIWLVFGHLPLPQLHNLRRSALDRNWDINLDTLSFRQLCAQKHPNMSAVMVPSKSSGGDFGWGYGGGYELICNVGLHSEGSILWQKLKLSEGLHASSIMCSSDGGLVCFAIGFKCPVNDIDSMTIVVANPLTGKCRELPAHGLRLTPLKMMQLVMDQETKHYQMILVGHESGSVGGIEASLFDSGTRIWTNSKNSPGLLIFGQNYWFKVDQNYGTKYSELGHCAYDCDAGKLRCLGCTSNMRIYSTNLCDNALVKDRL